MIATEPIDDSPLRSLLHLAHFLDATSVGFVFFDETGVIRDCNETAAALVASRVTDLLGRSFDEPTWRCVHHDDSPFSFCDLYDAGNPTARADVIMGLDVGATPRRWLSVSTFPVNAMDGRGVIATLADVTDKMRRERLLEIVSEVNRFAMEATDEHDALQHLCDVLVAPGRHALAWVGTASTASPGEVEVVAAAGATDYLREGLISWSGDQSRGQGPVGTALRTGEAQIVQDVDGDPAFAPWRERARDFGIESVAAIAFSSGGRRVMLAVYDRHVYAFDDQTMAKLVAVVQEVEFSIEHIRSVARLAAALDGTLAAISRITETRDPYTAGHQTRVGALGGAIAEALDLDASMVRLVRQAGDVHDVGKIAIPAEILTRPGELIGLDFEMVKSHCAIGADILAQAALPWPLAEVALEHHERLDGSGYPRGLCSGQIILPARIIAVADVVEAMMHHRPYRVGLGLAAALEEVSDGAGRLYDADVVAACLAVFAGGFRFTNA